MRAHVHSQCFSHFLVDQIAQKNNFQKPFQRSQHQLLFVSSTLKLGTHYKIIGQILPTNLQQIQPNLSHRQSNV